MNSNQVPRGCFALINKCESTLDALINSIQVPISRFLINKCENNSKYIDNSIQVPRGRFLSTSVKTTLNTLIIVSRSQEVVFF